MEKTGTIERFIWKSLDMGFGISYTQKLMVD
jgi:hypothetical protein